MIRRLFFHPQVQVISSVLLMAASQIFLRKSARDCGEASASLEYLLAAVKSGWMWLGVLAQIGSLLSWLYALRHVSLNVAYNLSGLLHVIVPVSCFLFLDERIVPMRWLGIALVLAGVFITAEPAAKLEEEIEGEIEEEIEEHP